MDVFIRDIESGYFLSRMDVLTLPCDGEILEINGKKYEVVTSYYEPSLMGMSSDAHIVLVDSKLDEQ